eukprot:7086124-Pyramimonas_sp.AAC.2
MFARAKERMMVEVLSWSRSTRERRKAQTTKNVREMIVYSEAEAASLRMNRDFFHTDRPLCKEGWRKSDRIQPIFICLSNRALVNAVRANDVIPVIGKVPYPNAILTTLPGGQSLDSPLARTMPREGVMVTGTHK